MRTLIVGAGALGGTVAARLYSIGAPVSIATRDASSADRLRASGLRLTGIGGDVLADAIEVAAVDDYVERDPFDLILLATKAHDAIVIAPKLVSMLGAGGTLLPIQNGGVSQILGERFGTERVIGGLSNLGATMTTLGEYEQRNAGHLLIGELTGGESDRAESVRRWLGRAIEVKVTSNLNGAIWSKLLLNCSVTTIGAIAGETMRRYIASPEGREVFDRTYDEALSVALASGVRLEKMIVDPMPPNCNDREISSKLYDAWLAEILEGYGDLKPSMLQDIERGRTTEIDFINGYVANLGGRLGIATPINGAIVEMVYAITQRQLAPNRSMLRRVLQTIKGES